MKVVGTIAFMSLFSAAEGTAKQMLISSVIALLGLGMAFIGWKGELYAEAESNRRKRCREHDASYPTYLRRRA